MPTPKSTSKLLQSLVTWTPCGLGIATTAGFFLNQEIIPTILASFLTGCSLLWAKFSGAFMAEAELEVDKLGKQSARGIFRLFYFFLALLRNLMDALTRPLVHFGEEIASGFRKKYYQRLDYICRNFEAHGLDKERIRSLEQTVVTVNVTPKSFNEVSPNLLRKLNRSADISGRKTIGDFLAIMRREPAYRRLAILGAPGSGKTTLMRYMTLMYALGKHRRLHPQASVYIPMLLYLREIYEHILKQPDITLADLLEKWVQSLQKTNPIKPPPGWFDRQIQKNRCLILLDGLDEIADDGDRQQVSQWVDRQMYEHPKTAFILTSRPLGYEKAQLKQDVQVLEVEPLTSKQIEEFVQNWYTETELKSQGRALDLGVQEDAHRQASNLLAEIAKASALQEFASNPLLLTMIATVHRRLDRLPLKRVELYAEMCQVLLEKRQRAKGIDDPLTATQKQAVLQPLALDLMQRNTRTFTFSDVESLLIKKLAQVPQAQLTPTQFFRRLQEVDALIAKEKEGEFEFAHKSFQEYLAAVEIKANNQEALLLAVLENADPNASENLDWWAETLQFYAAQADASTLIAKVLKQPNLERLQLGIKFWQDGLTVEADVQTAFLQTLNAPLCVLDVADRQIAEQLQPRYFMLAYYLQAQQWYDADLETWESMKDVGDQDRKGYLTTQNIQNIPCSDLRVLDQLWLKYSEGKFGLSVQKQIWVELGGGVDGEYDYTRDATAYKSLIKRCGWGEKTKWDHSKIEEWPKGHLPRISEWRIGMNMVEEFESISATGFISIVRPTGFSIFQRNEVEYVMTGLEVFSHVKTCEL